MRKMMSSCPCLEYVLGSVVVLTSLLIGRDAQAYTWHELTIGGIPVTTPNGILPGTRTRPTNNIVQTTIMQSSQGTVWALDSKANASFNYPLYHLQTTTGCTGTTPAFHVGWTCVDYSTGAYVGMNEDGYAGNDGLWGISDNIKQWDWELGSQTNHNTGWTSYAVYNPSGSPSTGIIFATDENNTCTSSTTGPHGQCIDVWSGGTWPSAGA